MTPAARTTTSEATLLRFTTFKLTVLTSNLLSGTKLSNMLSSVASISAIRHRTATLLVVK